MDAFLKLIKSFCKPSFSCKPSLQEICDKCEYNGGRGYASNPKANPGNTSQNTDTNTHVNLIVAARNKGVTLKELYASCGNHWSMLDSHEQGWADYYTRCKGRHMCFLLYERFPEYSSLLRTEYRKSGPIDLSKIPDIEF